MTDVPETLRGILMRGENKESLEAIRNYIARILDSGYCDECKRSGPEPKDVASLTFRLVGVVKDLHEYEAPAVIVPGEKVTSLDDIRRSVEKRTGVGTEKGGDYRSVARRQFGRKGKRVPDDSA